MALAAALVALLVYGWRERAALVHPTSLAIVVAIILVTAAIPLVYRGPQDALATLLILPMLSTIALGMLARPARWVPGPSAFAVICLVASLIALLGGAYEYFVLGIYRPGLGNNPIHYGSLAAMAGGLALVGVVGGTSPWPYLFLLGPVFGLSAAVVADSRGPMLGAVTMSVVGVLLLASWLWRETLFRMALLISACIAIGAPLNTCRPLSTPPMRLPRPPARIRPVMSEVGIMWRDAGNVQPPI